MKIQSNLTLAVVTLVTVETAGLAVFSRVLTARVASLKDVALAPLGQVLRMERALSNLQLSLVKAELDDHVRGVDKLIIAQGAADLRHQVDRYVSEMTIRVQPKMREILRRAGTLDDHVARETGALAALDRDSVALTAAIARVVDAVEYGDRAAAGAAFEADVAPHLSAIQASLDVFAALQYEQVGYVVAQVTELRGAADVEFVAIGAGSILLATIAAVVLARRIVRPVGTLIAAADRVASGDLSQAIPVASHDEIGHLSESFERMTARLRAARRQVEDHAQMLQANERQLNEAQKIADLGNWTWDIGSNAVTWSDEQFRIFGLEPGTGDQTFETYMEFVHPDERAFVTESLATALQTRQPFEYDQRIVRRDGMVRILHARGEVIADAHGVPIKMLGTGQDVTDRVAAQDARRKSEDAFSSRCSPPTMRCGTGFPGRTMSG
jgi:PAS domain S-box-containing protein